MLIPFKKRKGFTLIEILLIFAVIAIVSTGAITSYINSTKTFNFLNSYKTAVNIVRVARSYAITNLGEGLESVRYGVYFRDDNSWMTLFKDTGDTPYKFESTDEIIKLPGIPDGGVAYATYGLHTLPYGFSGVNVALPMTIFFEAGTGEVTIYEGNNIFEDKQITLKFTNDSGNLERYMVIFKVSGQPEEFATNPGFQN